MKNWVKQIWTWADQNRTLSVLVLAVFELLVLFLIWRGFACWFDCWFDWVCSLFVGVRDFLKVIFKNATLAAALFSAPIAYLIWAFRNNDKQREINQKDIELDEKTFNQLQQWACDTSNPDLQVVAINQLCPYVLGEHGERFKRPTFILLKTLWFNLVKEHLEKIEEEYLLREYEEKFQKLFEKPADYFNSGECFKMTQNWKEELRQITKTPLGQAINYALLQKKGQVFRDHEKELPTACFAGLRFGLPNLDQPINLSGLDMRGIDLRGAKLSLSDPTNLKKHNLKSVILKHANLSLADFYNCDMENADLSYANTDYAVFNWVNLVGANLKGFTLQDRHSTRYPRIGKVEFHNPIDPQNIEKERREHLNPDRFDDPSIMWTYRRASLVNLKQSEENNLAEWRKTKTPQELAERLSHRLCLDIGSLNKNATHEEIKQWLSPLWHDDGDCTDKLLEALIDEVMVRLKPAI